MNRNIYYHLSGYKDITILEPTIPTHALEKENKTISRISIGLSVGDCLKGLAPIEVNIDSFIELRIFLFALLFFKPYFD
jgi:hypothetical protein